MEETPAEAQEREAAEAAYSQKGLTMTEEELDRQQAREEAYKDALLADQAEAIERIRRERRQEEVRRSGVERKEDAESERLREIHMGDPAYDKLYSPGAIRRREMQDRFEDEELKGWR